MIEETPVMTPASQPENAASKAPRAKTLKFFCRCGQKVQVTFPARGTVGKCPKCGHKFDIPQDSVEDEPGPGGAGQ